MRKTFSIAISLFNIMKRKFTKIYTIANAIVFIREFTKLNVHIYLNNYYIFA